MTHSRRPVLAETLRQRTAAAHEQVERAMTTRGFLESREGYRDYLLRLHRMHGAAERALTTAGACEVIPDWNERCKERLLRADLATLGAPRPPPLDVDADLGEVRSAAQILGVAYVLEGSTLGGAMLLRSVSALGITAACGGSFLASYGAARGTMWQRFIAVLEAWSRRDLDEGSVIEGALRTFAFAARCIAA